MTVALLVSRPGNMPGYTNTVDLDEVQSLSRYCFFISTHRDCVFLYHVERTYCTISFCQSCTGHRHEDYPGKCSSFRTAFIPDLHIHQELKQKKTQDLS